MNDRKKAVFIPNPNRKNKTHKQEEYTPEYVKLGIKPSDPLNFSRDFKKEPEKNVRPVENKVQNQYREIIQNKGLSPFKRTAVPSKSQLEQSLNVGNNQEQVWKSNFYNQELSEAPIKDPYDIEDGEEIDFSDVKVPEEYLQHSESNQIKNVRPKLPLTVESTTYEDEMEQEVYFPEVSEGSYFVMYKNQFHQDTFSDLTQVEEFINDLVFGSEEISLEEIQVFKKMEIKTGIFVK
jgi:hypothetical protein